MQCSFRVSFVSFALAAALANGGCIASGSGSVADDLSSDAAAGDPDAASAPSPTADAAEWSPDAPASSDGGASTGADALAADGAFASDGGEGGSVAAGAGHVVFRLAGRWRRIEAKGGGATEDLTSAFDALSAGTDDMVGLASSGAWLSLTTTRFGCKGYGCLALVHGDLGAGELLTNAGSEIHATGRAAASAAGDRVVFPAPGPHAMDAYAITRTGPTTWSAPVLLTAASSFAYHHDLAISADGAKATFDCGADPYGAGGTAICEAMTDGTGFRQVQSPGDATNALHHPGYAPDGSTVFEGAWTSEQIWRLPVGATTAQRLAPSQTNDNTPCALPSGKIASLWLSSPTNPHGLHELKIMSADGATFEMALAGQDIEDIGIACGQ